MAGDKDPFPFRPGQMVMAKYSTFPAWPAVIIADYHIQEDMRDELSEESKASRKRSAYIYFFGDRNFGIAFEHNIKPLDLEAEKKKKPATKKSLAKRFAIALNEAAEYKGYWALLVQNKLVGKDETPYELKTISDVPEHLKKKNGAKRKSIATLADDPEEAVQAKKKQKRKSIVKADVKESTESTEEVMSEEALSKQVYSYRFRLQKRLVQRDNAPKEEELKEADEVLKEVENFVNQGRMTLDLLRHSKLYKVMKVILREPSLARSQDYKFHERAQSLVLQWKPFLDILATEKLRETPNTSHNDITLSKSEDNPAPLAVRASNNIETTADEKEGTGPSETHNGASTTKSETVPVTETHNGKENIENGTTLPTNGDAVAIDA